MPPPDNQNENASEKDRIERLRESLYSPKYEYKPAEESSLNRHFENSPADWRDSKPKERVISSDGAAVFEVIRATKHLRHISILKKILLASAVFLFLAAGIAAYVLFFGVNRISSDNIAIQVSAPVAVAGGDIFPLQIQIDNKNNTALLGANLLVEYPLGTRNAEDVTVEMPRYSEILGDIQTGGQILRKLNSIIYGEGDSKKTVKITVEYKVAGANSIFYKDASYDFTITSAPVNIVVNAVKEINSGQNVAFDVEVDSNSANSLQDLMLKAEYPAGFSFTGASPAPNFGSDTWKLGDYTPGAKRVVHIQGVVNGQEGDEKGFRFSVGAANPRSQQNIGIVFLTHSQSISITRPFIGLDLQFSNNSGGGSGMGGDVVARNGDTLRGTVSWMNNTSDQVSDAVITVKLRGNIFDRNSVQAENGFYSSLSDTIVWDQTTNRSLVLLNPGDKGSASFSMAVSGMAGGSAIVNPQMAVELSAQGKRLSQANVPELINASVARNIKLQTTLGLIAKTLYGSGAFLNTGPQPPVANAPTTYTVYWSVNNSANEASDVRVYANLPSYVQWVGKWSPASEKVSYNSASGQILWEAGNLPARAGFSGAAKELYFQVSLIPSISQRGSAPNLVGESVAEGQDQFTGTTVRSQTRGSLTTRTSDSSDYNNGVVQIK